jgi:hypothetical protein
MSGTRVPAEGFQVDWSGPEPEIIRTRAEDRMTYLDAQRSLRDHYIPLRNAARARYEELVQILRLVNATQASQIVRYDTDPSTPASPADPEERDIE